LEWEARLWIINVALVGNVYATTVSIELHLNCTILFNSIKKFNLHEVFEFVVEDQHQATTSTSEYVGECTLKEGRCAFVLVKFTHAAVQCALIHALVSRTARLHLYSMTSGRVKWIGHNTSECCYKFSDTPWN